MKKNELLASLQEQINTKFSLDKLLYIFSAPIESHISKKNNRPVFTHKYTGRAVMGKRPALSSMERWMTLEMKNQANKQGFKQVIDEPLWAIFHFYFTIDKYMTARNRINLKLPDLSNLYELPQDCLQDAGIISNDTLIHSHDLSRRLIGQENKLEIFLLKYDISSIDNRLI